MTVNDIEYDHPKLEAPLHPSLLRIIELLEQILAQLKRING